MNWKRYWSTYPRRFERTEYLKQVKNTVRGVPVSDALIDNVVEVTAGRLGLEPQDALLDLCCGNGLVTKALARRCRRVVGVDFSEPLIDVARSDHAAANVEYELCDVRHLDRLRGRVEARFTKVLMIAGLQYLQHRDLAPIVEGVLGLPSRPQIMLFTAVPDRDKRELYYDGTRKRVRRALDVMLGRDQMGTWWQKSFVERIAAEAGFGCRFYDDDAQGSRYRFDVALVRR